MSACPIGVLSHSDGYAMFQQVVDRFSFSLREELPKDTKVELNPLLFVREGGTKVEGSSLERG